MKAVFIHLSPFVSEWRRVRLTDEDLRSLESVIMGSPQAGAVMSGTGGLRKIRFAPASRGGGKSGGFRVCYAHFPQHSLIVFYALFGKNDQSNLTAAERNMCRVVLKNLYEQLEARGG